MKNSPNKKEEVIERFGTSQYMIVFCKFDGITLVKSIFIWRPSELVQLREEKKIIICGRSEKKSSSKKFKGESDDSDDDDTFSLQKNSFKIKFMYS